MHSMTLAGPVTNRENSFRVHTTDGYPLLLNVELALNDLRIEDQAGVPRVVSTIPGLHVLDPRSAVPRYFTVVEVAEGLSAAIDSISLQETTRRLASGVPDAETVAAFSDVEVLELEVERMRGRTFVRVGVNPFRPVKTGVLSAVTSLVATVRISSERPSVAAVRLPVQESATTTAACAVCPSPMAPGVTEGDGAAPTSFVARRSTTNDTAWRITLSESGLYRVTGTDLANAGVPPSLRDVSVLGLAVRDKQVPVWASTGGTLNSNDWIMFYGTAVDSVYATQNVYWLTLDDPALGPTLRNAAPNGALATVSSSWNYVEYAPRNLFNSRYKPRQDMDNWFAKLIGNQAPSNIVLETPAPWGSDPATLRLNLHAIDIDGQNNYDPDHRTRILLSTNLIYDWVYEGAVSSNFCFDVSASHINGTGTTLVVDQLFPTNVPSLVTNSANVNALYLQEASLCYQRRLTVDALPYYFAGPTGAANVHVSGLGHTNLLLLDISDPAVPVELTGFSVSSNAGNWSLEFEHTSGTPGCYAIFSNGAVSAVSSIELVRFRGLSHTNRQVDYVVVSPDEFKRPVYRLLKHRFKNGLNVQAASPSDVYNEYSFGVKDPAAIRQYFGYAYHHYGDPGPEYALLFGNGSLDPRDDLGNGDPDLIPTRMGWSVINRTSIDQWFATVDGSGNLADIRLGRIPASTVSNAAFAVSKIISYETSPTNAFWFNTALLVADDVTAGVDFKAFTEENTVMHLTNGGFDAFGIFPAYLDDYAGAGPVRNIINTEIETGLQIVNFIGHGGEDRWASHSNTLENVWNTGDALSRSNTVYPVVSVFTCQNGAFHNPSQTLAEAIVLNEHGGSACFAPSTFAIDFNSEKIADGYYAAFATNGAERVGDAVAEGFFRLWSVNTAARELLFYTVIGDPAQTFRGGAEP